MNQLIIGLLVNGSIVYVALKKQLLTISGGITAFIVGMSFYLLGGFASWSYLIMFFISSGLIEMIKKKSQLVVPIKVVKEEANGRGVVQVLANSVPALSCLILYVLTDRSLFYGAMVATIAGAAADTWSSQIGILSKKAPISILTGKEIKTGLSGGISILGLWASLGGALFLALLYSGFHLKALGTTSHEYVTLAVIIVSGVVGSLIDSFLGATIQEKYRLIDDSLSEIKPKERSSGQLYSGIKGIDNNAINCLSGLLTAIFAISLFLLLR